jgi:pilus assembly protein CpaE
MLIQHPHLVQDVHVAIVAVEFTLAATRDAIRILSWLKANAPQARVLVVANRVPSGAQEISRKDFEQSIERSVDIVVPFEPKAASQSAKLGQPFAKVATSSKINGPLTQLVNLCVSTVEGQDGGGDNKMAETPKSLLDKLNLKGLVAKKPKPATA